ncbi:hypothetical protein LA20531_01600 [Lactobacillus amylovorus DSM 20531]|uniref:hypothetical protein n=1 Tax=Lactobacillus amylovorus TaxID=1604 RepID=UPI0007052AD2|nr:hypothetical protein [Lactobacillus amylovorus]ATO52467.1 hypothetical protein LA20531_01600 [Lactobacillus amylovorus DSM 20531]MCT3591941.1 hypothetical protein [Lactobacillus amylovorus]
MDKEQIKIKIFVLKADDFEDQVNDWFSRHPNIKILHRYVNNDWVSHTGVSGLGTITTAMITAIVEYIEEK